MKLSRLPSPSRTASSTRAQPLKVWQRSLRRFVATHGSRSLGLVAVVILVFLVILDSLWQERSQRVMERDELLRDVTAMTAKVELRPSLDERLVRSEARMAELLPSVFQAPHAHAAAEALKNQLASLAAAAQARAENGRVLQPPGPAPTPAPAGAEAPAPTATTARIAAETGVSGYTQKLVRVFEALMADPHYIRVTAVDLKVNDPVKPGELLGHVVAEGVWLATPPAEPGKEGK